MDPMLLDHANPEGCNGLFPPGYYPPGVDEDGIPHDVDAFVVPESRKKSAKLVEELRNNSYPGFTRWLISIRNLERWRTGTREFRTMDFQHMDPDSEEMYCQLDVHLTKHYSALYEQNAGTLPTPYKKGMLAVARLQDGAYRRVSINPSTVFHPSQVVAGSQIARKTLTDCWILLHKDFNISSFMSADDHLFKISPHFQDVPPRIQQLVLTRTEEFIDIPEFRDALCRLITEDDVLEASLDGVGSDKFAYVTLWSPKFKASINQIAKEHAVASFRKPRLPQPGDVLGLVHFSHLDPDGTAFVQIENYMYQVFKSVERKISPGKFIEAKKAGPYHLNTETIYITEWDGAYARIQLHELYDEDATVNFIDYGNFEVIKISEIVPCATVSSVFEKFHPQAIQAHLVNVGSVDEYKLFEMINLDKDPTLQLQVVHQAEGKCAYIELLLEKKLKRNFNIEIEEPSSLFRLTEFAFQQNVAMPWDEPILRAVSQLCLQPTYPQISMKMTNWGPPGPPSTLRQPPRGSLLDVVVLEILQADVFWMKGMPANILHNRSGLARLENEMRDRLLNSCGELLIEEKIHPFARGLRLEKGMFYSLHRKTDEGFTKFSRARLLDDATSSHHAEDKVHVLLVDYAAVECVEIWQLFVISADDCARPPYSALFTIRGRHSLGNVDKLKLHRILVKEQQRVLVKVDSTYYEESGRCIITGDIYLNEPGYVPGMLCRTLSADRAIDKQLDPRRKFTLYSCMH